MIYYYRLIVLDQQICETEFLHKSTTLNIVHQRLAPKFFEHESFSMRSIKNVFRKNSRLFD